MNIDIWLLGIAIFLILIDVFISSDLPTFIAYILFSVLAFRHMPGHIMFRLCVSVIVFFALVFLYYYVWYKFKKYFVDKWFAKDIMKTGMEALIGEHGTVRIIDGVQAAQIRGDLYTFSEHVPYEDGREFIVKAIENGAIVAEFHGLGE